MSLPPTSPSATGTPSGLAVPDRNVLRSELIRARKALDPAEWERRGMFAGAPFSAAHSLFQTGPFRPANHWGRNVVFVGSGTQPGVGVPMVLVSGRLAAERVTGPMPARQ